MVGRRQVDGMPGIVQHAGGADDEIDQVLVIGAALHLILRQGHGLIFAVEKSLASAEIR